MEILDTLAIALGFATLAGLNLYLTVFITGLAINMQWVDVSTKYPELAVLGEPGVIIAAGIFFCFEFFSDKVPWVDSLWDTVHTLIRPVGGGLLAIHTLGATDPAFDVIIGMLAGGTTLLSHGFKSGSRLAINSSPEPFTNVAASVGEDVAVLAGLALMWQNPLLFAIICVVFLGLALYLAPKLFRRIKAFCWLVAKKVQSIARYLNRSKPDPLANSMTADEDIALATLTDLENPTVLWSSKVLVGKSKRFRLTPWTFGRLIAVESDEEALHFVGRRLWKHYHSR
ncbi:MAG: DUF4126 domain-containing protein, partial [Verrucomicrobiota bacterium]